MTARAEKKQRLAQIGRNLDNWVRRLHSAGVRVPEIAARLGLERESVRAAIRGWASGQARNAANRRREA